jgi:hypothetical protein
MEKNLKKTIIALFCASSVLSAATAPIAIRARNVHTGLAISSAVFTFYGLGPESSPLILHSNQYGRVDREIAVGHYTLEISAPGYDTMRDERHVNVTSGKTFAMGYWLTPSLSAEEHLRQLTAMEAQLRQEARPGATLVSFVVLSDATLLPLAGANITGLTTRSNCTTDSAGRCEMYVPTAAVDDETLPASEDFHVVHGGYKAYILQNHLLQESGLITIRVDMTRGAGQIVEDDRHGLDSRGVPRQDVPDLVPVSPAPAESRDWSAVPGTAIPVDGSTSNAAAVPANITVGFNCTGTACTGTPQTFTLEAYVAQGLPNEWLPNWAQEAFNAGAVAYRGYGAWYVLNPLSSTYDICNNTYCQVFSLTQQPTVLSTTASEVTSGIVMTSLNSSGQNTIFRTEYAAELNLCSQPGCTCPDGYAGQPSANWPCMADPICTGKSQKNTHGRGMCQYGSQRWATGRVTGANVTPPRDWRCILNHYYNDNGNATGAGQQLRTSISQPSAAVPDGALPQIVYSWAEPTASAQIYSMNINGTNVQQLTTNNGYNPNTSPGMPAPAGAPFNRGIIVFNGDVIDNPGGLSTMYFDGTDLQSLTSNGGDDEPNWSYDGTNRIVFSSARGTSGCCPQMFTVNADGSGLTQITNNGEVGVSYPSWSPNGSQIVYETAGAEIHVVNADGTGDTTLLGCNPASGVGSCEAQPSFSPDGTRIVYASIPITTPQTEISQIWVMNADGSNPTQLSTLTAGGCYPSWAGYNRIVFISACYGASGAPGGNVYIMNSDGSAQMPLTNVNPQGIFWGVSCSGCYPFNGLTLAQFAR